MDILSAPMLGKTNQLERVTSYWIPAQESFGKWKAFSMDILSTPMLGETNQLERVTSYWIPAQESFGKCKAQFGYPFGIGLNLLNGMRHILIENERNDSVNLQDSLPDKCNHPTKLYNK